MDNKMEAMSKKRSRNNKNTIGNYIDILTSTPAPSVIYDDESIISFDDEEDDNSIISFDTMNDTCIDPEQVMNMPSGYDPIGNRKDSATYDFSNHEQMRVFQKPDFVKERRNNRIVVDTNNNRELENSQHNYPSFTQREITSSLHSQFNDNLNEPTSYMDGVIPYDG